MQITINPRFQSLIPPLAAEELAQLEKNLLADGCRDPLVLWKGTLVDGHHRYRICQRHKLKFETAPISFTSEDAACAWIIQNQFGRRNLPIFVRAELALKLEPLIAGKAKEHQKAGGGSGVSGRQKSAQPTKTREEVAKAAGLSHDTIAKVKFIQQNATQETQEALRQPDAPSINRVYRDIKEQKQEESRKEKRTAQAAKTLADGIIVGDFRKQFDKISDGSLSLIFTDPPYDREAEKLFPALADFAASKLSDGGSIIFYLGHLQLPAAFAAFNGKLRHWWTCACLHGGDKALMREYGIRVGWKPMLWFVKGTRSNKSEIVFDTVTGAKSKDFHDWQQHEEDAAYYIDTLCPKDGIVCDPFLGGGTTAAAAKALHRKWIAFEIDPNTAAIASQRIGL